MRLVIVGGGVAAELIADQILRSLYPHIHITILSNDQIAPSCSLRSMPIVANRGVSLGISPLGDELFHAFKLAQEFYPTLSSAKKISLYHVLHEPGRFENLEGGDNFPLTLNLNSQMIKTEPAWMVDPVSFFQEMAAKNPQIERKTFFVQSLKTLPNKKIELQSFKDTMEADEVLLCQGAYPSLIKNQNFISVQGRFLEFKVNLGFQDFALSTKEFNLIYHENFKRLWIGATSEARVFHQVLPTHELYEKFNQACSLIPELKNKCFFEKAEIQTGVRSRTSKRRPVMEILQQDPVIWQFNGFYKNGWTLPLLAASKFLATKI
jgi:hypothetical protein